MNKKQSNTEKSKVPYQTLRSLIRDRHGSIWNWAKGHGFPPSEVTRVIKHRPQFVYNSGAGRGIVSALESDFGITPDQLGIKVLEVER